MRRNPLLADFAVALDADLNPRLSPTSADLRDEVLASAKRDPPEGLTAQAQFVIEWTRRQAVRIEQLQAMAEEFSVRLLNATNRAEREAATLDLAERLGADERQLDSDAKAFARYFDADAVLERCRHRISQRERALAYGLARGGELVARGLANGELTAGSQLIQESFVATLGLARVWRGDGRVRQAAHRAMRRVTEQLPRRYSDFWVDLAVRDTRRVALNAEEDAWSQLDAMAVLLALSPVSFESVLARRLQPGADRQSKQAEDNRLFVRRELVRMLVTELGREQSDAPVRWLRRLVNDSDGAVRQVLAFELPRMPPALAAGMLAKLRVDADPQVRAALFADPVGAAAVLGNEVFALFVLRVLAREADEFVLRIAVTATSEFVAGLPEDDPATIEAMVARLRLGLAGLRARSDNVRVRRWAGLAREKLWLLGDPAARELALTVRDCAQDMREGTARKIKALHDADPERLGRVLAVLSANDFGFEYFPGRQPRLRRGDKFVRRLWRVLFEGRISATDKRQAWLHTIGRRFSAPIIAPSMQMAELAPTKVPGEPLHLASDAGWRNYLPLLDHVLSAIDRGGETRIFTSEGITTLSAPLGLWHRIKAYCGISWNFATLAAMRNQPGNEYVTAIRARGVGVALAPHSDPDNLELTGATDPEVLRLYSAGGVIPLIVLFWTSATSYFATVYENTLPQLGLFVVLASLWFWGRHVWRGRRMRTRRSGIALVLGGWGTRGKSGTERLKAGLINALGHPLVSKTTGCEAMFLLGHAFGDLQEMFLFRPYDKATIWEQFDLIRTSRGLGARVFLWECMGLTPSYVRVLQRDWMRDDISTITNTYPDHEDVQGPAGRNIPEVMTQFIPENSILLTTEEEMLPILREGADLVGTRLRPVGWKEAGLIHQSLLTRFPYAEHPFNIALVTAMADELGLEADFSVKEMADRVVADLGVLKIYPRSTIEGRVLEFVMGMSANERFGAMGNWQRMGFAAHDLGTDPEIFISTVVNNRADRVPRSRVFARVLVEDVSADRHVLIGSNIEGLLGFIDESWEEFASKITIFREDFTPQEAFTAEARRQRVPLSVAQIEGRLAAMLAVQSERLAPEAAIAAGQSSGLAAALQQAGIEHADDIVAHYDELAEQLRRYEALCAKIAAGGDRSALDQEVRQFLRDCFMAKLVPVREFYTPGEEIVRLLASETPPGLVNRIMGMQNIKGTGLDFVYRWQAWEACHKACQQAAEGDPGQAQRALDFLGAFQEYGVLSDGHVRETLARLREAGQTDLRFDAIEGRLGEQLAALESSGTGGESSGGGGRATELLEAFLDSTDAIRRRRAADRIYRDLIAEQISSQRAALELKKLTSRQKGGWLASSLAPIGELIALASSWRERKSVETN